MPSDEAMRAAERVGGMLLPSRYSEARGEFVFEAKETIFTQEYVAREIDIETHLPALLAVAEAAREVIEGGHLEDYNRLRAALEKLPEKERER